MSMKRLAAAVLAAALVLPAAAGAAGIVSTVDAAKLPETKQTPLGLYLTPKDAHAALEADAGIVFIDVRDPIEIAFVGHAASADANVPLRFASHVLNAQGTKYTMVANDGFVAQVDAVMAREGKGKDDPEQTSGTGDSPGSTSSKAGSDDLPPMPDFTKVGGTTGSSSP